MNAAPGTRPFLPLSSVMGAADEKPLLRDVAYEGILALLLSGDLLPGATLYDRKLAEHLGISRTPVREALAKLESEGLVAFSGKGPTVVRAIDVAEFLEILNFRRLLEGEAAASAATRGVDPKAANAARQVVLDLVHLGRPTLAQYWQADDAVHGLISAAAQNKLLARAIVDLRRRSHIFNARPPERLEPGAAEHIAIIDAVLSGDPVVARQRMVEHIDNVKAAIVDRIASIGKRP
jgi:DNA-binding GntR family transcriptional regulator